MFEYTFERWPYHAVKQDDCGPRRTTVEIQAENMMQAAKIASTIRQCVEECASVWVCKEVSLVWVRY